MPILNLISGPRNISTALMYSFAQRNDTVVLDEPFYAVYLKKSGADHPGKDMVMNNLPPTEQGARLYIAQAHQKPVLFVKNMAHHMEVLESPWIPEALNIILIRDPAQIIASYSEVIERPVMRDIGVEYQFTLLRSLQNRGISPLVVDSGLILRNPEKVLSMLCNQCGIDFQQRMLHWPAGPKPYDGVWATHWYQNVHTTTGFEKQPTSSRPLPDHLSSLYETAKTFYEKLLAFSLKA